MTEQTLAVQRMQDYIETHIDTEVTLVDLARVSFFSPWYSYRLFRECIGLTPAEYVRKIRLSRAALQLRDDGCRVTDVAFSLGFGSVDGFTRAFYKEFGCNPGVYARNPVPIGLFVAYGAKYRALRKDEVDMTNVASVFVERVQKPERLCLIRRGVGAEDYFSYCEEMSCDIWGMLLSMRSLCGEPVCMWLPERYRKPHTSVYVQGVEVETDYRGIVPEGFDEIRLPETEYLRFQGQPFAEEDYCEAIRNVQHAMDNYDPTAQGYEWDDTQPRIQLEPIGTRGYIELRAVKRIGA